MKHSGKTWWGEADVAVGKTYHLRIGGFHLWVSRYASEWRLATRWEESDDDQPIDWERAEIGNGVPDDADQERYVMKRTQSLLRISPVLADRPVISRPVTPFFLPQNETTTVYVSSPLWLEVTVHPTKTKLREFPIVRPSDTWFGPSTLEGELSYAMRTSARLELENVPQRPHRAITPVIIINQADSHLLLERMSIPVPYLPLYNSDDGFLWTPEITLTRQEDTEMAALKIASHPPGLAKDPNKLQEARAKVNQGILVRAFNALFTKQAESRHVTGSDTT